MLGGQGGCRNDAQGVGRVVDRVLVVMRHAKAEPYADEDRDRRLTARGRADAAAAGRHLLGRGLRPDYALVSSAARTRETWEQVREACGCAPVEEVSDTVYAGTSATVLDAMRQIPDEHRTAVFVGHNPSASYLATVLHDNAGDPEALRGLLAGFPPAAAVVLELDGPWSDLAEGTARLVDFHVGRG